MTLLVDVVNRALQTFGARSTVTQTELDSNGSNEAIQANIIISQLRDDLLRMAPWDCGFSYINLTYITSTPGTPENPTAGTSLWQKGQPAPPWSYEYQYPIDCLRACWIVPQTQTGFTGIPITTAVTGLAPLSYTGPAIPFKVAIDQFYSAQSAIVATPGSGYSVGDILTAPLGAISGGYTGISHQLLVHSVSGSGGITNATIIPRGDDTLQLDTSSAKTITSIPLTASLIPVVTGNVLAVGDLAYLANATGMPQVNNQVYYVSQIVGGNPALSTFKIINGIRIGTAGIATATFDPYIGGAVLFRVNNLALGGGGYFSPGTDTLGNFTATNTSGASPGTGALFYTSYSDKADQRVVLTNQEFATLAYVKRVTDPNVMDTLFLSAWIHILGARLCKALTSDTAQANLCIQQANDVIMRARTADGNEGLTINDVTPDWIRVRGYARDGVTGAPNNFDWGPLFPLYA